jgi:arginase
MGCSSSTSSEPGQPANTPAPHNLAATRLNVATVKKLSSPFLKIIPPHSSQASHQVALDSLFRGNPDASALVETTIQDIIARWKATPGNGPATPFSKATLLHVPSSYGQPEGGVELGGALLLPALQTTLPELKVDFEVNLVKSPSYDIDGGDVVKTPATFLSQDRVPGGVPLRTCKIVGDLNSRLAACMAAVPEDTFPLVLGGDHSIAIGSLAGVYRACKARGKKLGIIWVDAHADINTPQISPSGNIHGMPLSFLANLEGLANTDQGMTVKNQWTYPGMSWMEEDVPHGKENILEYLDCLVYIGLRDIDASEGKLINGILPQLPLDKKILSFLAHDVARLGIEEVMKQSFAHLSSKGVTNIHLSYDVDAIDPAWVPATGTDVVGGLTLFDAVYVSYSCFKDGRLTSMDNVELNPSIAGKTEGSKVATLIASMLNMSAFGKLPTEEELQALYMESARYDAFRRNDIRETYAARGFQEELAAIEAQGETKTEGGESAALVSVTGLQHHLEYLQLTAHFKNAQFREAGDLREKWHEKEADDSAALEKTGASMGHVDDAVLNELLGGELSADDRKGISSNVGAWLTSELEHVEKTTTSMEAVTLELPRLQNLMRLLDPQNVTRLQNTLPAAGEALNEEGYVKWFREVETNSGFEDEEVPDTLVRESFSVIANLKTADGLVTRDEIVSFVLNDLSVKWQPLRREVWQNVTGQANTDADAAVAKQVIRVNGHIIG